MCLIQFYKEGTRPLATEWLRHEVEIDHARHGLSS